MHEHEPAHLGHAAAHGHTNAFESDRVAALLEVEGDLSSGILREAIGLCAGVFDEAGVEVRRVVDLGCGPGVSIGLLVEGFPAATVVAVDGSRAMLDRAESRVARLGHAARVEFRRLDLNGDLRGLGPSDLMWAAMAIHHAQDEVATLRRIRLLLGPGGLACVLERADPPSVRSARDLGRPGIWERLDAARSEWFEGVRERMPGAVNAEAYPALLAAAGLDVVVDRTLTDTVVPPDDAATHEFLGGQLRRTVRDLADVADEADLEALAELVELTPSFPEGRWAELTITSSRKLFIARPTAG